MLPFIAGGMAVGMGLNLFNSWNNSEKEKERLRKQKEMEAKAYGYQKQYTDASFGLQREQALDTLRLQDNRLAQSYGMDMESFNLGVAGQAEGNQAARIALGDSAGAALAQQGMSGVRGSETLQRRIDYQEGSYERQIDLQNQGNALAVSGMAVQYGNAFEDIEREVVSWGDEGYRTRAKGLSDTYAAQMQRLKMEGYNQAIDAADMEPLDWAFSALNGAYQGASFGAQLGDWYEQAQTKKAAQAAARNTEVPAGAPASAPAAVLPAPAPAPAGPAPATVMTGNSALVPGTQAWGDYYGLSVDSNGYWYNKKTNSWRNLEGGRDVGLMPFVTGPGAR